MNQPKRILLDIDGLVWMYALAPRDKPLDFGEEPSERLSQQEIVESTLMAIDQKIQFLMEDLGCLRFWVAFGCPGPSFRVKRMPQYKAKRPDVPAVVTEVYHRVKQKYAADTLVHSYAGLEADDVLGMSQDHEGSTVVVSRDKDLLTIPGWNYNPWKPERGLRWVTPKSAKLFLLYQALMGDSTDGYPGCPGIGKVKAEDILSSVLELFGFSEDMLLQAVLQTYVSRGQTPEDFLDNLHTAYILGGPQDLIRKAEQMCL